MRKAFLAKAGTLFVHRAQGSAKASDNAKPAASSLQCSRSLNPYSYRFEAGQTLQAFQHGAFCAVFQRSRHSLVQRETFRDRSS